MGRVIHLLAFLVISSLMLASAGGLQEGTIRSEIGPGPPSILAADLVTNVSSLNLVGVVGIDPTANLTVSNPGNTTLDYQVLTDQDNMMPEPWVWDFAEGPENFTLKDPQPLSVVEWDPVDERIEVYSVRSDPADEHMDRTLPFSFKDTSGNWYVNTTFGVTTRGTYSTVTFAISPSWIDDKAYNRAGLNIYYNPQDAGASLPAVMRLRLFDMGNTSIASAQIEIDTTMEHFLNYSYDQGLRQVSIEVIEAPANNLGALVYNLSVDEWFEWDKITITAHGTSTSSLGNARVWFDDMVLGSYNGMAQEWLEIDPVNVSLAPSGSADHQATVRTDLTGPGNREARILFYSNDPSPEVGVVSVMASITTPNLDVAMTYLTGPVNGSIGQPLPISSRVTNYGLQDLFDVDLVATVDGGSQQTMVVPFLAGNRQPWTLSGGEVLDGTLQLQTYDFSYADVDYIEWSPVPLDLNGLANALVTAGIPYQQTDTLMPYFDAGTGTVRIEFFSRTIDFERQIDTDTGCCGVYSVRHHIFASAEQILVAFDLVRPWNKNGLFQDEVIHVGNILSTTSRLNDTLAWVHAASSIPAPADSIWASRFLTGPGWLAQSVTNDVGTSTSTSWTEFTIPPADTVNWAWLTGISGPQADHRFEYPTGTFWSGSSVDVDQDVTDDSQVPILRVTTSDLLNFNSGAGSSLALIVQGPDPVTESHSHPDQAGYDELDEVFITPISPIIGQYPVSGILTSEGLCLTPGDAWDRLETTIVIPGPNLTANYSILDGNASIIPGFVGLVASVTDLSAIDPVTYPCIKIRFDMTGDSLDTPIVSSLRIYSGWGLLWAEEPGDSAVWWNTTVTLPAPGPHTVTVTAISGLNESTHLNDQRVIIINGDIDWSDVIPPISDAGGNMTVVINITAPMDGSASSDGQGIANWTWIITDPDGNQTIVYGENANFTYNQTGNYSVELITTDWAGNNASDTITVTVVAADLADPVADAGGNISVPANQPVNLDGSNSSDDTSIVNYTWTITDPDGNTTTVYGENTSFVFDEEGNWTVELNVTDAGGNSSTDTITVTVFIDLPPIADAGPDQIVALGGNVTFDGYGSSDDIGPLNLTWTFMDGGNVSLYGWSPSWSFTSPGVYVVTLTVEDGVGWTDQDTMTVTVLAATYDIPVITGWNLISWPTAAQGHPLSILDDSAGDGTTVWERVYRYDATTGQWSAFSTLRPLFMNDLDSVDRSMGLWLGVLAAGDGYITVAGTPSDGPPIPLTTGWNLVGYPFAGFDLVPNAMAGVSYTGLVTFDTTPPYYLTTLSASDIMVAGRGYWVEVDSAQSWG